MKITEITQDGNIYTVTKTPGFIGGLFRRKTKTDQYKDTGGVFALGGGHCYVNKKGEELRNLSDISTAIDNWRNRF